MLVYLLVLAIIVVLVCVVVYSLSSSTEKTQGFTAQEAQYLGTKPNVPESIGDSTIVSFVDDDITALIPFKAVPDEKVFSTSSHLPLVGLQTPVSALIPFGTIRQMAEWIYPLGREPLSAKVSSYYAKPLGWKRDLVTFSGLGDIYPLSIRDDGGTINPYGEQTGMLSGTRVQNSFSAEVISYAGFPGIVTRVEVNKASPVPYVKGLDAVESAHRIYSNPDAGSSCAAGTASDDYYIPSRMKADFALLTPLLSPSNLFFGDSKITYSKTQPSYSQRGGNASYYYSENSCSRGRTSWLASQSFDVSGNASGIIANLLLNPYEPVRKSGNGIVLVGETDKNWYEKTYRGRVRCSVQARFSSVTGAIAFLFDANNNLVYAEPLRAFNFPQSLGISNLETGYGSARSAIDIAENQRKMEERIAKARAAIDKSYQDSENAYNKMATESNRNIENTRVATRNGIAKQTTDSNNKINNEWNKVSGDITRMRQEIVDRQAKCDAAVQAKVNDLNKAISAGKKQSDIDKLRKKVEEQRVHEAAVCGKWISDHNRKMDEKMANYRKVKAEEEEKIRKKTAEEDAKLARVTADEKRKQDEKRAHETRVHNERTAHEQKIIADEERKHEEFKLAGQEKSRYPAATAANQTVGVLNQSLPVIAPFDLFKFKVITMGDLTKATAPVLSMGTKEPVVASVRTINGVTVDFETVSENIGESVSKARAKLAELGQLPIGGFEILSPHNSKAELLDSSFTDQTKRTFVLDTESLRYGQHNAMPKLAKPGYNDYILNQYTHNYYYPWIKDLRTKYVVIENCTANTKSLIALGLFVRKYSSDVMDPAAIEPVLPEDILCYYPTTDVSSQYSTSDTSVPLAKLIDPTYPFPEGKKFYTDDDTLKSGPFPLIGAPHFSREKDWYKKAGGQEPWLYPSGSKQIAVSTALTSARQGTASKTIILVFREPINLYSINYISRTVPRATNEKFEKIATTGFNIADKDVIFRNCNYVTLYNGNTQCISNYSINDSLVDSSGTSGIASTDLGTNLLSVATFGPSTVLETSSKMNIFP